MVMKTIRMIQMFLNRFHAKRMKIEIIGSLINLESSA